MNLLVQDELNKLALHKPYLLTTNKDNIHDRWLYRPMLHELSTEDIVILLKLANLAYRLGEELISNDIYDNVLRAELQARNPQHPYLHTVEPAPLTEKTIPLPIPMLSTKKVYSKEEVAVWIAKVLKIALSLQKKLDEILFKLTPKLDGFASYNDKDLLITRGDDYNGNDISHVLTRGLPILANADYVKGAGEIVVESDYFNANIKGKYSENRVL